MDDRFVVAGAQEQGERAQKGGAKVDADIIYELGNTGRCIFGNKGEVFGFKLVEI